MAKFVLPFLAGCAVTAAVFLIVGRLRGDAPPPAPARPNPATPTVAVAAAAPATAAQSRQTAASPEAAAPNDGVQIVPLREATIRARLVLPSGVRASSGVEAWWKGGHAESDFIGGILTIHVTPGGGRASFHVPGCVVVERDADPAPGGVVDWGEMTLVAAEKLTGRVIDAEHHAIDAFIYPTVGDTSMPLESTDEAGAFSFDGLPYGEAELRVEGKGFVTHTEHYVFSAGSRPVLITVAHGGGVRGIVLDPDGLTAPKVVYVTFVDRDDPKNRDRMGFPHVEDDGGFEVHLLPGRYRAATTLGYLTATADVDVVEGETRALTLRLR